MDDAVRVRDAAHEAVDDIEPDRLREVLFDRLSVAPMTPAVLALVSARAPETGVDTDTDGLAERAAGVQLIYEGLRLTRSLAHDEPWTLTDESDVSGDIDADLDVLAADVLVSRGFYLLARTDAADRAVDVVRAFGRDQTLRRGEGADADALDRNLEADVFALAVVVGMTAVGETPSPAVLEYASELGRECDRGGRLQSADAAFSESTTERIASLSTVGGGSDDRVPSSATDS
ncbi:DUF7114 family protein [Halobellus inordinatus]|uniref:DUF7114 family protein n=1 Tax=Halobellus inordinatus TaxID=1126236 RepID=UPI00210961B2|nr:hypothetical protein [Halobellus inordinatus]